jgi:bifunctional DNA-binding transcriptional regulator/antitoxin component of YhaV-PrlF toxin-antitoxin module
MMSSPYGDIACTAGDPVYSVFGSAQSKEGAVTARRAKVLAGGRLIVPAEFRKAMAIDSGDTVIIELEGDELRVRSLRTALNRARARLRRFVPEGISLSDELIAERRAEAERD